MSGPPEIRWELFMEDGRIVRGEGQDAPGPLKLSDLARDAIHARFIHPAGTLVYVAGSTELVWTIQNLISYEGDAKKHMVQQLARGHLMLPKSKALGLTVRDGSKVWMFPDGSLGIGRSIEDAGRAWMAFHAEESN